MVVAAGWGAAINFLLAISPGSDVQGMLFWLIGDLACASHAGRASTTLISGLMLWLPLARDFNLCTRGELVAASLSADAGLVRTAAYVLASLMTARGNTGGQHRFRPPRHPSSAAAARAYRPSLADS
ncbi:MAG: iron chelate uptake ABC transporter family permease subunit [Acidiferrobacterales bacterium]